MSTLISVINALPIRKITAVYLTGSDNDYYKLYLVGNSKKAVLVDLKKGLHENFLLREKRQIYNGDKTQVVDPKVAIKLLGNCKYDGQCFPPNKETFDTVLQLLKKADFKNIQQDKVKKTFYSWIVKQCERDDAIGDLAYDILRDNKLSRYSSFGQIKKRISSASLLNVWEINSFRESKKEGSINPFLTLKLAKEKYDIFIKKTKLKKFAIRDTSGLIYFFRYENQLSPVKIGRAKNIDLRKKQLQTSSPCNIVIIGYVATKNYFKLEKKIHQYCDAKRINREWFDLTEQEAMEIIIEQGGEIHSERNNLYGE